MAINDRYLCFSELRQGDTSFGALVEVGISDKVRSDGVCLTLVESAAKTQKFFMSLDGLPKNLTGKNGFIKFSSKARPKIEIKVRDSDFSLDLLSMVDFINTFQDPNNKLIYPVLAVLGGRDKIVRAFVDTLTYLNMGFSLKNQQKIQELASLVCTKVCAKKDIKIAANLRAQLDLLQTPVLLIKEPRESTQLETENLNGLTDSSDETDSLADSSEGVV